MPATLLEFGLRLALHVLLLASALAAQAASLPPTVLESLAAGGIDPDDVAVWAQPIEAETPELAFHAERAMNPASVMKLVTAFAALDRLGSAYTWTTRATTDAALRDGVLRGDLYLVGSGDPVLSHERLWHLLRQLRALGIGRVAGDIVLDGSALRLPPFDPDAFDGRGLRPYNAGAHGMLMNFNALNLTFLPAPAGAPVSLLVEPPIAGLRIDNRLVSSTGDCGLWYGDLGAALDAGASIPRLVLSGSLPAACGRRDWNVAPLPTERFLVGLVSALWAEVGGRLDGRVRAGAAPNEARLLIEHESPPLADVVRDMNKWSSNLIARQLFATLGATTTQPGGTDMVADGAKVVRDQLETAGIPTDGLVLDNGAGLSRIARVRADGLGALLLAAWRRPWMPEFIASMPVAGVDGTARKRLDGSPVRGRVHIKTGTLDGVRSMAGYVLDRHGRRHAVVMMVNGARAAASQAAQDALLEWLWKAEVGAGAAGPSEEGPAPGLSKPTGETGPRRATAVRP